MLKKWKKTIKILATTVVLLVYLTTALFSDPTLKPEEENPKPPSFSTDRYLPPTIRTLIAYSDQFRIQQDLQDRIDCGAPRLGDGDSRASSGWTHDSRLGIRAFSAYLDSRQEPYHYVRVVALLRRNSSFYCQVCHQSNTTVCVTHRALTQEIWSPHWGPKARHTCDNEYPAIVSCLAPAPDASRPPTFVSFVDKDCEGGGAPLPVTPPPLRPHRANFVVCVKPLNLTLLRPRDLLEWVEINLRLGAEKIVFYGEGRAPGVGGVMGGRSVEWRGFRGPQRRRCPPRSFEDSVWHKRKMEIIAYNDCFYSNLYYTKFVIPLDVDEIIVPKTGNDWFEAFRSHFGKLSGEKPSWPPDTDNYASFSVRNAYFFGEYPKDAILMLPHRNLPKNLVNAPLGPRPPPTDDPFARTLRSYRLSPNSDSVKSFISVPRTLSVFNHYAFHVLGDGTPRQFIFPEDVFQLNHYRHSCDPLLIDGCREFLSRVVFDNSLERFRRTTASPPLPPQTTTNQTSSVLQRR